MPPEKIPRAMPGMAGTFRAMATMTMMGGRISRGFTLKMPAMASSRALAWLISALPVAPERPMMVKKIKQIT